MNNKILDTICSMLGPADTYTHFADEILIHINSAINVLTQLGVGPEDGFMATKDTTWDEYINENKQLQMVKQYIYLKVKLMFDPPANSFVQDAMSKETKELEWRIDVNTSRED